MSHLPPPSTPAEPRCYTIHNGIVNFYVVASQTGLICVDAGWSHTSMTRGFRKQGMDPSDVQAIFLTHLHWDHARGTRFYPNANLFVSAREPPSLFSPRLTTSQPLTKLTDNQTVSIAGLNVRMLETPGHTTGSASYVINDRLLFTGDTLRIRRGEAIPFWPWLGGRRAAIEQSLHRLARLEGVTRLLTAHTGTTRDLTTAFRRWRETPTTGNTLP